MFILAGISAAKINPDSTNKKADSVAVMQNIFVNKILIAGNEVTDDEIIRRELSIKENSILNISELEEDVKRIYRLGLFNKVDVMPVPTEVNNKFNLLILVEERFYILPLPQGGFRDGEFSKFWAGLNVRWNNFRGRNETAGLSFGIGYEPFINVSYSVPWIGKDAHFFSSADVSYSKNFNRSLIALNDTTTNTIPATSDNFANYNFNASYSLGKYFSKDLSISTRFKYHIIETSQYESGRTVSKDGKDNFLTFSVNGTFDTRNSTEYTLAGSYYSLLYEKFGFGKLFDFNRINFETKKFIPIKLGRDYAVTFASRTIGAISFGGKIPTYLYEFFGYDKLIRGYKKIVFEGENQLGIFSELRIPVIDPFYIKGEQIPIAKKISMLKKLNYKFGLYATIFFDAGGVWNKNNNFFDTKFRNGFGVGLNFILPFGFVGRTDLAFRKEQKRFIPQIVIDLDASF